jgi:hypothetical protein
LVFCAARGTVPQSDGCCGAADEEGMEAPRNASLHRRVGGGGCASLSMLSWPQTFFCVCQLRGGGGGGGSVQLVVPRRTPAGAQLRWRASQFGG